MQYSERSRAFNFLAGLLLGAAIGTVLALILAPETGRRTRTRLIEAATDARRSASGTWGEAAAGFRRTVLSGVRAATGD